MDHIVLPPPLDVATACGHPLELWILVNGEIVQCVGSFLSADHEGQPRLTASLPEQFVGDIKPGAAARGFFTDDRGQIHTFLSSVRTWVPFKDRPRTANVTLASPSTVAPCQRRRGVRRPALPLTVELSVVIRGERETVEGRLVDVSPSGLGVRVVRAPSNWFSEGTALTAWIDPADGKGEVRLSVFLARVERQALHFLFGLRVANGRQRKLLEEDMERLRSPI